MSSLAIPPCLAHNYAPPLQLLAALASVTGASRRAQCGRSTFRLPPNRGPACDSPSSRRAAHAHPGCWRGGGAQRSCLLAPRWRPLPSSSSWPRSFTRRCTTSSECACWGWRMGERPRGTARPATPPPRRRRWVPQSPRLVVLGTYAAGTGTLQVVELEGTEGKVVGQGRAAQGLRCGAIAASAGQLAAGGFGGALTIWDLERPDNPVVEVEAHEGVVHSVHSLGGSQVRRAQWLVCPCAARLRAASLCRRAAAAHQRWPLEARTAGCACGTRGSRASRRPHSCRRRAPARCAFSESAGAWRWATALVMEGSDACWLATREGNCSSWTCGGARSAGRPTWARGCAACRCGARQGLPLAG